MPRQKMSLYKRAAQFLPFQAVKGLDEALRAKEEIAAQKNGLFAETCEEPDESFYQSSFTQRP